MAIEGCTIQELQNNLLRSRQIIYNEIDLYAEQIERFRSYQLSCQTEKEVRDMLGFFLIGLAASCKSLESLTPTDIELMIKLQQHILQPEIQIRANENKQFKNGQFQTANQSKPGYKIYRPDLDQWLIKDEEKENHWKLGSKYEASVVDPSKALETIENLKNSNIPHELFMVNS